MSKEFWNKKGENYRDNWTGKPDQAISEKELNFIVHNLKKTLVKNILDIGCGTGRILNVLSKESVIDTKIYGIDYAQNMVDTCKKMFFEGEKNSKIQSLERCDVSKEDIKPGMQFDFITSIRVLKYNENWKDIIVKVKDSLNSGGRFVFTMPNKYSASYFSKYGVPVALTTVKEVRDLLEKNGFIFEDAISFSRIPKNFYAIFPNSQLYAKFLIGIENILSLFFGKHVFGKIIFFVAKKV
jgi:2-polyprenyl-3-methyl-5-hydroxy-6-metoxy-1,4-benzoquinol methylase